MQKVCGDCSGAVNLAEVLSVLEESRLGDGGVMKAKHQVWLGSVPFSEEICGTVRNEALVGGDGAIGEKKFFEGEVRGCPVEEVARFREMSSRRAQKAAGASLLRKEETEVLTRAAM
jgi:hypothetical protein